MNFVDFWNIFKSLFHGLFKERNYQNVSAFHRFQQNQVLALSVERNDDKKRTEQAIFKDFQKKILTRQISELKKSKRIYKILIFNLK